MSATLTNGKPRKQLSDQLDRLDGVIDLLATNLNQAVADAVQQGARQAVKDAVVEILTNPELRALIAGPVPAAPPAPVPTLTPTPSNPQAWARFRAKLAAIRMSAVRAVTETTDKMKATTAKLAATVRAVTAALPARRIALVAAGVGAAIAVLGYWPHRPSRPGSPDWPGPWSPRPSRSGRSSAGRPAPSG